MLLEKKQVDMDILLYDGIRRKCTLKKVLYIPEPAYNLISVARAGDTEKTVHFDNSSCEFRNKDKIIAVGARERSLYHLRCAKESQEDMSMAQSKNKERLWHHRFGYQSMKRLVKTLKKDLISQIDYNTSKEIGICKSRGIRHKLTTPKTPEQIGAAEQLCCTLVETIMAMLLDVNVPHKLGQGDLYEVQLR